MSRRAFDLDEPYTARAVTDPDPDGVLVGLKRDDVSRVSGWDRLSWIAITDKIDAVNIYAGLELHPIALHGLLDDGVCTCGKFPCGSENRSAGKHPVERKWQTAPFDLKQLSETLQQNPRFNVGLRMGRQRNGWFLVTVDVDGPRSLLEPLEREHGAFPETLTARSGSGGAHLIYRLRDGVEAGNRSHVVPKVDIRGTGGQIVAAPSRHRSGNHYVWTHVMEPAVLP
jgi:putative DNA primase/helicase